MSKKENLAEQKVRAEIALVNASVAKVKAETEQVKEQTRINTQDAMIRWKR